MTGVDGETWGKGGGICDKIFRQQVRVIVTEVVVGAWECYRQKQGTNEGIEWCSSFDIGYEVDRD